MKKIAITGGIASGKSQVSKIIEDCGGYVIYTDKINAELLQDGEYIKKLSLLFPESVQNGVVDKSIIRNEILTNDDKRLALNSLAHSEIKQKVDNLLKNFNGKTIFCEIPLIVESRMVDFFDEIWCVIADIDSKINRIMTRDKVSFDNAKAIIDLQKRDSELIAISNVVIENNSDINSLRQKVEKLYLERAK